MRKGAALLLVVLILAVFMILAAPFAKIVYNCYDSAHTVLAREQAFALASAGMERGKVELAHNPNWYTDLPYHLVDNTEWLINYSLGQISPLGDGSFKIVREKSKNRLYSIGSKGKGRVVLKVTFSNPPFTVLEWKEL
jgi:hypothetical protein